MRPRRFPDAPVPPVETHAPPAPAPSSRREVALFLVGLPLAWLAIAAAGIWRFARLETQPPVFDALSYVHKAQSFWAMVRSGHLVDPLLLEPQIRPFGTVMFTHPFGFTEDFRSFFFHTAFLPALLTAVALVWAGDPRAPKRGPQLLLLGIIAVVGASMPAHFQFDAGSGLPVMGAWGFVDTLLGAVGALACAAVATTHAGNLTRNSIVAALLGVLAILLKPAGLALMAIIAGAWGLVQLDGLVRRRLELRPVLAAGAAFAVIYLLAGWWLHGSPYFSGENYRYGISSMRLLHAEQPGFPGVAAIFGKLRVSIGIPVLVLLGAGLACALRRRQWVSLALALGILAGGAWLWLGRTNIDHVRYFFPFPLMALAFLVKPIVDAAGGLSLRKASVAALLLLPSLLIAVLLFGPAQRTAAWQARAGISLATNMHAGAVAQARSLVETLAGEGDRKSIVYYSSTAGSIAFEGVTDWHRILGLRGGNSIPSLPIDWVREHAYRLDQMIQARFIVFDPVKDAASVLAGHPTVASFDEEQLVVLAWLSGLGERDGVAVRSDGEVRVLEVLDRGALSKAGARLMASRTWRDAFVQGFHPAETFDANAIASLPGNLVESAIPLFLGDRHVADITGLTRVPDGKGWKVRILIRQVAALPRDAGDGWTVFLHDIGEDDVMLDAYAPYRSDEASGESSLAYDLAVRPRESGLTRALGVGVFRADPKGNQSLMTPGADWDGRRSLLVLGTQAK
jgi:hypothetical protein